MRWHRLLRALAFVAGIALGVVAAIFIFSNIAPVDVHWRIPSNNGPLLDWTLGGVSLWLLAIVPLLAGGVLGYLYQTPARMHHFREHMRHLHRVHELEKELKEVRTSLDKVLMMPDEAGLAVPAALMAPMDHRPEPRVAEVSLPEEAADFPDPEMAVVVPEPEPAPDAEPRPAPRREQRRKQAGLKAELAAVKLPDIPSTVAAQPGPARKGAANGGRHRPAAKRSSPARTSEPS